MKTKYVTKLLLVSSIILSSLLFPSDSYSRNRYYNRKKAVNPNQQIVETGAIKKNKYYLQNTKKELEHKKAIVETLKKEETNTSFILAVLQKKIENTSIKLADTQYRYQQTQRQIKVTDVKLKEAEKELHEQIQSTINTVRRLYKYRYIDYLLFLFNSDDISTFMRRVVYFNYVLKQDNDLINSIKKKREEIRDLKHDFQDKKLKIATISQKMSEQKSIYEDQTQEKEEYLHEVQTKKKVYEKEVQALEDESNRIASMLRRLIEQQRLARLRQMKNMTGKRFIPPVFKGGRMGWPCASANLTSYFGYRTHPIFGTRKLHTGVDVGAHSGTHIYAAADGVIIESGWMGGYGKAVIIDHGSGIATLYGHTSQIYVSSGQPVKRGQLIAAVGSTGFSTGPHLHFEVRVNGSPVDPLAYLR